MNGKHTHLFNPVLARSPRARSHKVSSLGPGLSDEAYSSWQRRGGKSTMARQIIGDKPIPRLSLDEIAWDDGPPGRNGSLWR